jgi:hypothetical protein
MFDVLLTVVLREVPLSLIDKSVYTQQWKKAGDDDVIDSPSIFQHADACIQAVSLRTTLKIYNLLLDLLARVL